MLDIGPLHEDTCGASLQSSAVHSLSPGWGFSNGVLVKSLTASFSGGKKKKKERQSLICRIFRFLWYTSSHRGCFQVTAEQGSDVPDGFSGAGANRLQSSPGPLPGLLVLWSPSPHPHHPFSCVQPCPHGSWKPGACTASPRVSCLGARPVMISELAPGAGCNWRCGR